MISPFEYITVLISIILGMGITHIVAGIAQLILHWDRTKIYWPHLILIVLLFVIHIQEWWVTYDLRSYKEWRLPTFLLIILYPVNLYVLARMLFPTRWGKSIDLKKFYFDNYRKIYVLIIISAIQAMVDNIWIGGYKLADQEAQMALILILTSVVLSRKENEWVHQSVTLGMMALLIISFWLSWDQLIIINS